MNPMNTLTIPERIEKSTSEVPLMNAEQKEALGLIDMESKTYVQAVATSDLIGVIAGIKPVAFLHDAEISLELVSATGMSCEPILNGLFAASRDENLNLELRDVFLSYRDKNGRVTDEGSRKTGELLGYPDTAVDYFVERSHTVRTSNELPLVVPLSTLDTPSEFFNQFILSPNNYQEEMDTYIKPLEAAVKELAPNTYNFIEKQHRHKQTRIKMAKYLKPLFGSKPKATENEVNKLYVD